MAENKEYMIHQEEDGAIQISEDVVASIASTTASEVEGVSAMMGGSVGGKKMSAKGVRVEMDGEQGDGEREGFHPGILRKAPPQREG